jgi:hypothetical protein
MQSRTQVNSATHGRLISFQLSFTTADVERSVFHGTEAPIESQQQVAPATILLVHGDFYALEEQASLPEAPLTEGSGIFHLVDLVNREQ